MVLEKIKKRKKETKFSSRNCNSITMANHQEHKVKLTNTQLNKLKSAAKNKAGTILKINNKNFEDEELPHELFLTTRQTTKVRNAFANNMSTDIKLSKAQTSKMIQSGGSFGSWLGNLGKRALTNIAIPLARDVLAGLVSNLTSNAINKFERKTSGKGAVRGGKGFTLFILNENMSDIIIIIKSLEDSAVLIDGIHETIKREIKKQEGRFLEALLAPLATSLVQLVIFSVVKGISGRVARRAGRGCMDKKF